MCVHTHKYVYAAFMCNIPYIDVLHKVVLILLITICVKSVFQQIPDIIDYNMHRISTSVNC